MLVKLGNLELIEFVGFKKKVHFPQTLNFLSKIFSKFNMHERRFTELGNISISCSA